MRVITDTTTSLRNVEVLISTEEVAARLGYTGLHVVSFHVESDGMIVFAMQNGKEVPVIEDTDSKIEAALQYGLSERLR